MEAVSTVVEAFMEAVLPAAEEHVTATVRSRELTDITTIVAEDFAMSMLMDHTIRMAQVLLLL